MEALIQLSLIAMACGAMGGVTTFIYSFKKNLYKNNQYLQKLTIEILGGGIVAAFVSQLFTVPLNIHLFVSFAIGCCWAGLIHLIRVKITKLVEAAIGESGGGKM